MRTEKPSSLVRFWRRLEDRVHPDDMATFKKFAGRHTFNLDYPPPAYVGDVDRAPVLLLMANGGYETEKTPAEFAEPGTAEAYRMRLHNPAPIGGSPQSQYYTGSSYSHWLADGTMALVNAVAYRSPKLSDEPHNQRILPQLASVRATRDWLLNEVVREVEKDRRMVVVHRWKGWDIACLRSTPGFFWSKCPASPHLSDEIKEKVTRFSSGSR